MLEAPETCREVGGGGEVSLSCYLVLFCWEGLEGSGSATLGRHELNPTAVDGIALEPVSVALDELCAPRRSWELAALHFRSAYRLSPQGSFWGCPSHLHRPRQYNCRPGATHPGRSWTHFWAWQDCSYARSPRGLTAGFLPFLVLRRVV